MIDVPDWLELETFAVQHNPNCPSRYMVRLIGNGKGGLDMKPYCGYPPGSKELTSDALGFGKTLEEAAEAARAMKAQSKKETGGPK